MRRTMAKAAIHTAANLLFFTLIGTAMLALTYKLTRSTIALSVEQEKLRLITQIAPPTAYENDIMKDVIELAADELLGTDRTTVAYRGRIGDKPSIAVLEAIAPDGYGGKVNLIIAIGIDGKIGGVRVVSHNETPGLGDYIEIGKDKWITIFNGRSMEEQPDKDWKVRKDGGQFDYRAGATVTPRAIIKSVHKALRYYAQHREEIFLPRKSMTLDKKQAPMKEVIR